MTSVRINSQIGIPLRYANRHGLIIGPTGTGKTVTLQTLAEGFSRAGVAVFVADVKGDISALSRSCPVRFVDLFGTAGQPIGTTIRAMGANVLGRALELNDVQSAVVEIAFAYSDMTGRPLNTLAEFRKLLGVMTAYREEISRDLGLVTAASIGAVQRACLRMDSQGGSKFFGNVPFDVSEMLTPGLVTILAAETLLNSPRVYAAFLLHMLDSLYCALPEVGDMDKPRLVFFFDEAHLLFRDMPGALLGRVEQTVRLIRSKGVGVYFVTQSARDIPELVREQLAHVIEHDRSLPVGTARVVTMTETGRPTPLALVKVQLPYGRLGPLSAAERGALPIAASQGAAPAFNPLHFGVGLSILALVAYGLFRFLRAVGILP